MERGEGGGEEEGWEEEGAVLLPALGTRPTPHRGHSQTLLLLRRQRRRRQRRRLSLWWQRFRTGGRSWTTLICRGKEERKFLDVGLGHVGVRVAVAGRVEEEQSGAEVVAWPHRPHPRTPHPRTSRPRQRKKEKNSRLDPIAVVQSAPLVLDPPSASPSLYEEREREREKWQRKSFGKR